MNDNGYRGNLLNYYEAFENLNIKMSDSRIDIKRKLDQIDRTMLNANDRKLLELGYEYLVNNKENYDRYLTRHGYVENKKRKVKPKNNVRKKVINRAISLALAGSVIMGGVVALNSCKKVKPEEITESVSVSTTESDYKKSPFAVDGNKNPGTTSENKETRYLLFEYDLASGDSLYDIAEECRREYPELYEGRVPNEIVTEIAKDNYVTPSDFDAKEYKIYFHGTQQEIDNLIEQGILKDVTKTK